MRVLANIDDALWIIKAIRTKTDEWIARLKNPGFLAKQLDECLKGLRRAQSLVESALETAEMAFPDAERSFDEHRFKTRASAVGKARNRLHDSLTFLVYNGETLSEELDDLIDELEGFLNDAIQELAAVRFPNPYQKKPG